MNKQLSRGMDKLKNEFQQVDYDLFWASLDEADRDGYRIRLSETEELIGFDNGKLKPLFSDNGKGIEAVSAYIKQTYGSCKGTVIESGNAKGLYMYSVDQSKNFAFIYIGKREINKDGNYDIVSGVLPKRTISPEDMNTLFFCPSFLMKIESLNMPSAKVFLSASDEEVEAWLKEGRANQKSVSRS